VAASADDYQTGDNANTGANLMSAQVQNQIGLTSQAVAEIVVSLAGQTITEARLFWYNDGYTKSKSATFHQAVQFSDDGSNYVTVWSNNPGSVVSGWQSCDLTANLNKTGRNWFRFIVDDPGGLENRKWDIRTIDYGSTYRAYLDITHQDSGAARQTQAVII
jgi:hypothetical protein